MRKNYIFKLLFVAILLMFITEIKAQTNLAEAPNAVMTASSNQPGFGPVRLNDGIINACGFQECWIMGAGVSTANWIVIDFNSPQTFNAIQVFSGERISRYLSGATIQVWKNGAWVNHHTYARTYAVPNTANVCEYVENFARVMADSIRITNWVLSGNQLSNPAFREIRVFNLRGNDMGISKVNAMYFAGSHPVLTSLRNFGNTRTDSVNVEWSINGVAQPGAKVRRNFRANNFADSTINLGSFNFIGNVSYTIKAWTSLPNNSLDSLHANDTSTYTFTAVGKPAPPIVDDKVYCGVAKPILTGTPAVGTILNWYRTPNTSNFIGQGSPLVLQGDQFPTNTVNYYARSAFKFRASHTLSAMSGTWSFTGGASPTDKGAFVNMTPKANMSLDTIDVAITRPNATIGAGPFTVDLYYKVGLHNGFETNTAAWTLISSTAVTIPVLPASNVPIAPTKLSAAGIVLNANTQYSLFYQIKGVDQSVRTHCVAGSFQSNVTRSENESFIVDEGALSTGVFGLNTFLVGFIPEIRYYYSFNFESDSAIAKVTTNPKPTGAAIVGKTGSKGTFLQGTKANSDHITNGETIEYEFVPPTGYTDAQFGTTWAITALTVTTETGTPINALDTVTTLPGANRGTLTINPRLSEVDSLFRIRVTLRDLGPYNCDSIIERWVYVAPRPFADMVIPSNICDGDKVLFDNKSTIRSGTMFYKWYFLNNSNVIIDSSDAFSPVYQFPTFGTFKVRLRAFNANFGYSDDTLITLTVGEIPVINIKAINACEGIPVQFLNTTTAGSITPTFKWTFGDGIGTSIQTAPSYLYAVPNGYQVRFEADAAGCKSEKTINAYQFAKPVSNFNLPTGTLFCSSQEFTFTNSSTIVQGKAGALWDFKDNGAISTSLNPAYKFTSGGTFNIKLKSVSEFGCQDSISKNFTIRLAPTALYTSGTFCELEPTSFTNASINAGASANLRWDFGDGTSSTANNPNKNWSSLGLKTIKLVVRSQNLCSDSITKIAEVLSQPVANFDVKDACSGEEVQFVNLSTSSKGILSYVWNLGTAGTTTSAAPKAVYNVATSTGYNITLTANVPGGCPSTITKPLNIDPSPTCGFTIRDTFISGLGRGYYFKTANIAGASYKWKLGGDGFGPQTNEFFHKFTYFRPYDVELNVVNSSGCDCNLEQTVINSPTGIETISALGVQVYPNPSRDNITINGKELSDIKVFNAEGKLVYQTKVTSENTNIPISSWAAGIYQLEVSGSRGTGVTKIVKY